MVGPPGVNPQLEEVDRSKCTWKELRILSEIVYRQLFAIMVGNIH